MAGEEVNRAFLKACRTGDEAAVARLFDQVSSLTVVDEEGTAFVHACISGKTAIVDKFLAERTFDINALGRGDGSGGPGEEMTGLMFACFKGHEGIVKSLLDAADVDLDLRSSKLQRTALFLACEKGHAGIVEQLLENGADPNVGDKDGRLPIDICTDEIIINLINLSRSQTYSVLDLLARLHRLEPSKLVVLPNQQLGRGAFGAVHKGRIDGTPVAVKILLDKGNGRLVSEFRRELGIMARLRHPNLVFFMGCCDTPDFRFAMELANGGDLRDHLIKHNWSRDAALPLLRGIASGLSHLHGLSIVHGDLKPENVLIYNGTPKITDFGLSRVRSKFSRSTTNVVRGTFLYMAPEVLEGRKARPPADVYSFGILSFEAMSWGQNPFSNYSDRDVVYFKCSSARRLLRPYGLSDAVWRVIEDCCKREASERPASASLWEDLDSIIEPHVVVSNVPRTPNHPSSDSTVVNDDGSSPARKPALKRKANTDSSITGFPITKPEKLQKLDIGDADSDFKAPLPIPVSSPNTFPRTKKKDAFVHDPPTRSQSLPGSASSSRSSSPATSRASSTITLDDKIAVVKDVCGGDLCPFTDDAIRDALNRYKGDVNDATDHLFQFSPVVPPRTSSLLPDGAPTPARLPATQPEVLPGKKAWVKVPQVAAPGEDRITLHRADIVSVERVEGRWADVRQETPGKPQERGRVPIEHLAPL
ncbi:kinase-like domain-containing protein [Hyaloraphidium curvatum]|nr:kinase-like domain-containing protein [Hyaloraphidium curvatum]